MKEYPQLYEKETVQDEVDMPNDTENDLSQTVSNSDGTTNTATTETNEVREDSTEQESKAAVSPSMPSSYSDGASSGANVPTIEKRLVEAEDSAAEDPKVVTTEHTAEQESKSTLPSSGPLIPR